jgi:hypothetical protein
MVTVTENGDDKDITGEGRNSLLHRVLTSFAQMTSLPEKEGRKEGWAEGREGRVDGRKRRKVGRKEGRGR